MKSKILLPLILIAGIIFLNYSTNPVFCQTPEKKIEKPQTIKYTCPKHPEVVQDLPGNCPKCGMKLVEKKETAKVDNTVKNPNQKNMRPDSARVRKPINGKDGK
jgi:Heavy metal binding domain